jgi:hypothetical protein
MKATLTWEKYPKQEQQNASVMRNVEYNAIEQ